MTATSGSICGQRTQRIEEFIANNVAERAAIVAGRTTDRLERLAEAVHE